VLFIWLGESFTAYGGAMALAAVAAAVTGLVLGRRIDAGRGVSAAWLSFAVLAVTIGLRIWAATPAWAVAANAMGALVACTYYPTQMTAVYNLAQRSACPLRFQLVAEAGWDIGRGAGCLTAAALVALGAPLQATIALSAAGAVAVLLLLRRYYADAIAVSPRALASAAEK
jgi:hypothetical protein